MRAKHAPGPWHVCGEGKCSCFTVMADHHPIAQVTHGIWGDEYPEVRFVPSTPERRHGCLPQPTGLKAEAYMEMLEYGEIGDAVARANWHLIAAAPELLVALKAMVAEQKGWDSVALDAARAALAKAEPNARGEAG